jgi:hypothetical protein
MSRDSLKTLIVSSHHPDATHCAADVFSRLQIVIHTQPICDQQHERERNYSRCYTQSQQTEFANINCHRHHPFHLAQAL